MRMPNTAEYESKAFGVTTEYKCNTLLLIPCAYYDTLQNVSNAKKTWYLEQYGTTQHGVNM